MGLGLMASLSACLDAVPLSFPAAEDPYQSGFFVEECQNAYRVWAFGPSEPGPTILDRCPGGDRYYVGYFQAELAELGLEPGPVNLGDCAPEDRLTCTGGELPRSASGEIFVATLQADGSLSDWSEAEAGWPREVAELRFPRRVRCPAFSHVAIYRDGYERFLGVFLDSERVVILGNPDATRPETPASIHLFETTLSALRLGQLPEQPDAIIDGFQGISIAAHPVTKELYIGVGGTPLFLRGHLDGGLQAVTHPDPSRSAALLAVRPGSDEAEELVVRDPEISNELHFYRSGAWTPPFEDPVPGQMRGTCLSVRGSGQRASLFWLDERELVAMPHSKKKPNRSWVISATTTPDGYWHVTDGVPEWKRIPDRGEGDCLSLMADVPAVGLMAVTLTTRFYVRDPTGWREFEIRNLPRGAIDDELRRVAPIEHGFAYSREGHRFGYVADGVSCDELVLERNELDDIISSGANLLIFGDAPRTQSEGQGARLTGAASINLIQLLEAPQ